MSGSAAGLRRKIDGAVELQSVVRTMKALAASSIGQYERSVRALADYYRAVELGLHACLREDARVAPRAMPHRSHEADDVAVVVFGSDQGLVGQFNEGIADQALQTLAANPGTHHVWAVGERVHARLADAGIALAGLFTVPNSVAAITPLIGRILIETELRGVNGETSELHLVYNRPATDAIYATGSLRLLPLDDGWRQRLAGIAWPTDNLPQVMGTGIHTLRALLREYLFVSLFRACAESLASENASRLAAMQRAEKNIEELLESLRDTFHRLRQSAIDEELFDVIAGFEAVSGDSARPRPSVRPRLLPPN